MYTGRPVVNGREMQTIKTSVAATQSPLRLDTEVSGGISSSPSLPLLSAKMKIINTATSECCCITHLSMSRRGVQYSQSTAWYSAHRVIASRCRLNSVIVTPVSTPEGKRILLSGASYVGGK